MATLSLPTASPRPAGTALGHAQATALIARRLHALGHPPELLDPQAADLLIRHAAGSARSLRSSLAAVMFLASTEDAPRIDAALVRRALPDEPARDRIPTSKPGSNLTAFVRVALIAALGAALLTIVLLRAPRHGAAVLQMQPTEQPAALLHSTNQPPPPRPQHPAKPTATPPLPGPAMPHPRTLPTLPAPVFVRTPPVPATATPMPTIAQTLASQPETALPPNLPNGLPANLPTVAPASILLLYPASNATALARLRPIAQRLQQAGIGEVRARPASFPPPRRGITFFYRDDQPLAELIARQLAGTAWPGLGGNFLQPSLVLLPAGLPARSPGTIEIQLP